MMKKEIRTDLYTQSEYAKKIGVSRARVNQLIKEGLLNTVKVNGTTLIKVS
jgi:DNA-binding XRE family transcriptional regulator